MASHKSYCEIDCFTRRITVPADVNWGVENDANVTRVYFHCKNEVEDGIFLTGLALYFNYINADSQADSYPVTDVEIDPDDGDYIFFSWALSPKVTKALGSLRFSLCAKAVTQDGYIKNRWYTALTSVPIMEGLEISQIIDPDTSDLIGSLLAQLDDGVKNVQDHAERAEQIATDTEDFKSDAETYANDAKTHSETAETHAENAQLFASAAQSSMNSARASEATAQDYEEQAETMAQAAAAYAGESMYRIAMSEGTGRPVLCKYE